MSSTVLPLTVVKVRVSVGVLDFLREAGPQPPQISFNNIQIGNSRLEETRLDDAHFDAKVPHVIPGQKKQNITVQLENSLSSILLCYSFKKVCR